MKEEFNGYNEDDGLDIEVTKEDIEEAKKRMANVITKTNENISDEIIVSGYSKEDNIFIEVKEEEIHEKIKNNSTLNVYEFSSGTESILNHYVDLSQEPIAPVEIREALIQKPLISTEIRETLIQKPIVPNVESFQQEKKQGKKNGKKNQHAS